MKKQETSHNNKKHRQHLAQSEPDENNTGHVQMKQILKNQK